MKDTKMNIGLFEIALLVASTVIAVAGALAALTRRRPGVLLASNAVFAVCFGYFAAKTVRFGGPIALGLGLIAVMHVIIASALVTRAAPKVPTA